MITNYYIINNHCMLRHFLDFKMSTAQGSKPAILWSSLFIARTKHWIKRGQACVALVNIQFK